MRDRGIEVTTSRSEKRTGCPHPVIQAPWPAGEMIEHAGLEAIGEVFEPAASMIFGQAKNDLHAIKAILSATLGR